MLRSILLAEKKYYVDDEETPIEYDLPPEDEDDLPPGFFDFNFLNFCRLI